ncbi:MAG: hypothetical protein FWC56_01510 [Phycisphaerae bacterium]|nr:hypothetical protein [Phycisphaerae bacterium]
MSRRWTIYRWTNRQQADYLQASSRQSQAVLLYVWLHVPATQRKMQQSQWSQYTCRPAEMNEKIYAIFQYNVRLFPISTISA